MREEYDFSRGGKPNPYAEKLKAQQDKKEINARQLATDLLDFEKKYDPIAYDECYSSAFELLDEIDKYTGYLEYNKDFIDEQLTYVKEAKESMDDADKEYIKIDALIAKLEAFKEQQNK